MIHSSMILALVHFSTWRVANERTMNSKSATATAGAGDQKTAFAAASDSAAASSVAAIDNCGSEITTENNAEENNAEENNAETQSRELPKGLGLLPCIEQPSRCFINSLSQPHHRLTSTKRGGVSLSKNRGEKDQFFLLPVPPKDVATAGDESQETTSATDDNAAGTTSQQPQQKVLFHIKSYKFGRYLTSSADGTISTTEFATKENPEAKPDESAQWLLMRSPHGGHFLVSKLNEKNMAAATAAPAETTGVPTANAEATAASAPASAKDRLSSSFSSLRTSSLMPSSITSTQSHVCLQDKNDKAESWNVELVTGELCFMSAPSIQKQLRCDMTGRLTLTSTAKGWEVFRFIECGGGKLRICSWMHSQHFLCCNPEDGSVMTCSASRIVDEGPEIGMDEWYVEKAPGQCASEGVVIRSASSNRLGDFLCHTEEGVLTSVHFDEEASLWHLNAGHSQKYSLASLYNVPKTLGPYPYVTDNKKQLDEIIVEQLDAEGLVRLYHIKEDKYIGSQENGDVGLSTDAGNSELWKMDTSRSDGGYVFYSVQHEDRMLSYHSEGQSITEESQSANSKINPKLCTITEIGDDKSEVWRVDPVLPRAVSSSKIKTFAIGTSIAVGTTVAMPFAMAGLAAVVGTESILMGVVTVGLTSAEAIASVGAIGATAAICFRESGDTLGMESEHDVDDEEKEKPYMRRPLCAWRV
jgi:hypothetical protein